MGDPLVMSITITNTAAKHVNQHLSTRGKGVGLRLGVKTTGCSGLAYVIEFADKIESDAVSYTHLTLPTIYSV